MQVRPGAHASPAPQSSLIPGFADGDCPGFVGDVGCAGICTGASICCGGCGGGGDSCGGVGDAGGGVGADEGAGAAAADSGCDAGAVSPDPVFGDTDGDEV